MPRSCWLMLPAIVVASACSQGEERAAETPAAGTAAGAPPAAPAAIVTVLYHHPKDPGAFEKYYRETHLPLLNANQGKIGFERVDLTRFESALDGKKPEFYRQVELYFESLDELQKGTSTPAFKKVADDLGNFAGGGFTGMVATATNDHTDGGGEPGAIVTVLYKAPKDTAAFEKYYAETHLPLVVASQPEIGFTSAEFTRFNSSLDSSKPDRYRQAELYFPSMAAAKKGLATPAFKKVGDDLANFASGGLDAMIGVETK